MKTIGLIISHKNGERRRALLPQDIKKNVKNPQQLFFEEGYGLSIGKTDDEYRAVGCNIVSREEALACDVIADVKLGDADYLDEVAPNKILFGWAHAVQNIPFTSNILKNNHTVIAWEDIFENGRYIFYRNREVAGEAAIMHAYRYCGKMPYDTKVAILGNGQITDTEIDGNLAKLKVFYQKSGYMNNTPADLFERYLKTGMGGEPMIVDYEKSLIDFANSNPNGFKQVKDDIVVLYSKPTIWNSHCFAAFTEEGKELYKALQDEEISKIAFPLSRSAII